MTQHVYANARQFRDSADPRAVVEHVWFTVPWNESDALNSSIKYRCVNVIPGRGRAIRFWQCLVTHDKTNRLILNVNKLIAFLKYNVLNLNMNLTVQLYCFLTCFLCYFKTFYLKLRKTIETTRATICLTSYVLCLMSYLLCLLYYVLCIMSYVLCITYHLLCIMYHVLCILYYVFCIMYSLFCIMYHERHTPDSVSQIIGYLHSGRSPFLSLTGSTSTPMPRQ